MPVTPFLRQALLLDALFSAAGALLMGLGAPFLAPLTGLPEALLFWAAMALIPYVALLLACVRRESLPKLLAIDIVAINALWAAASFGLLAGGWISPNALGIAFVTAQALAVALFGVLQALALRRALATAEA